MSPRCSLPTARPPTSILRSRREIIPRRFVGEPDPDVTRNGLSGKFARINFQRNRQTDLRVNISYSCAPTRVPSATTSTQTRALATPSVCDCYEPRCSRSPSAQTRRCSRARKAYTCPQLNTPTAFPAGSLVSFSVYDLNTGPGGECTEELTSLATTTTRRPCGPSRTTRSPRASRSIRPRTPSRARLPSACRPIRQPERQRPNQAIQFFYSSSNGFIDASFKIT